MRECAICFHGYSPQKKPLVLPCGHTSCESCLKAQVRGGILSCPMCRKEFPANFSSFTVNYSLIEENPIEEKKQFNDIKAKLQEEIGLLNEMDNKLRETHSEFDSVNQTCEREIEGSIDTLISSLENLKNQLKRKIQNLKGNNLEKIKSHKQDIDSNIAVRKKYLKAVMQTTENNRDLDATVNVEINVLPVIKETSFKLQKAEFDHIITLISSDITEKLIKNLVISDVSILLNEANKKPTACLTDQEDRGSYMGRRNQDRGRRRGFRNYRARGEIGEVKMEAEAKDANLEENRGRGRVFRRPRGGRGRYNEGMRGDSSEDLDSDRQSSQEEHKNENKDEWFIEVNGEVKKLPIFAIRQINKHYKMHPKVRIYDHGKLANVANTETMVYTKLNEDGNVAGRPHKLIFKPFLG